MRAAAAPQRRNCSGWVRRRLRAPRPLRHPRHIDRGPTWPRTSPIDRQASMPRACRSRIRLLPPSGVSLVALCSIESSRARRSFHRHARRPCAGSGTGGRPIEACRHSVNFARRRSDRRSLRQSPVFERRHHASTAGRAGHQLHRVASLMERTAAPTRGRSHQFAPLPSGADRAKDRPRRPPGNSTLSR